MKSKTVIYDLALVLFLTALALSFVLAISLGSVSVPISETIRIIAAKLLPWKFDSTGSVNEAIIMNVRMPRVVLAALTGASLSVAGASMQGLLRNPLAESSTLGVSTFAALGAVCAMFFGISVPALPGLGTAVISIIFAFLSFVLILGIAYRIDKSLSTNTLILTGIILSMFAGSLISFLVTFSNEKLRSILFWTMGSFSGRGWEHVLLVLPFFIAGTVTLAAHAKELNAFALGEENAGYIGVNTKRVKLTVLTMVSVLVGACVSVSGSVAFVGLVIPHMTRMIVGPDHKRLIPFSVVSGMIFMMLTDLVSRTILSPLELPVGVVTSMIGSLLFIYIFNLTRKKSREI